MESPYTDDYISEALAVLDSHRGSTRRAARQLGIPESTLRRWASRARGARLSIITRERDAFIERMRAQKSATLRAALQDNAAIFIAASKAALAELGRRLSDMETPEVIHLVRALSLHIGIVSDKIVALDQSGAGAGRSTDSVPAIDDVDRLFTARGQA
jgi:hypothetical protein